MQINSIRIKNIAEYSWDNKRCITKERDDRVKIER